MFFQEFLKEKLTVILEKLISKKSIDLLKQNDLKFNVEISQKKEFGDVSTNIAMVYSKVFDLSPIELAELINNELKKTNEIEKSEILKPGFINIFFFDKFWHDQLFFLMGISNYEYGLKKKKICLEYVSANPTGLMHIGHARGAVFGDSLASILEEVGYEVNREYYINDAGEQINKLERTISFYLEQENNKKKKELPDDLYPGNYLKGISKNISKTNNEYLKNNKEFKDKIVEIIMKDIKKDLKKLKINHDSYISEKMIATKDRVERLKKRLIDLNIAYYGYQEKPKNVDANKWEKKKHFLFSSKKFGDDSDRALIKTNNELTYFMSDIIYHQEKLEKKYDLLINIWGVDHFGYVKRLKSAIYAINSSKKFDFEIKLTSLVNLMKNNEKIKMSKRSGNYVTMRDVMNEVGTDVLRFMMISRNCDKKIDFDFEIFLQKNKDNPVFYVQYAYARCRSILKTSGYDLDKKKLKDLDLSYLILDDEKLLIKNLCNFYSVIKNAALFLEPHRITNYLYDLSKIFHSYWGLGNQNKTMRIIVDDKNITLSRLVLVKTVSDIIKKSLKILKINCPESM